MKAAMKTVKEFKDAGLVFVNNDIIGCVTSDPDSGGITIGDATRNGELPIHDAWNVREFAWREKTSIMLGFIGKIECINEHGKPLKGPISYYACTKWRPLLKQNTVDVSIETPEEKEVLDKIFGTDSAPKPSKTVWDAVNELRGDLNNTFLFGAGDIYLFYCIDDDDYVCSCNGVENDNEKLACTIAEFNALVEEMTLGLDVNSVTHGELFNYVNADKTLLEKENNPLVYTQGLVADGCQVEFGTWSYAEAGQCLVADKSLLKKGSTVNRSLIYTQEMSDNGELPSVGMEFLHKGSVATTLSTSKEHGGVVTFTVDNGCSIECCWNNDAWVKPIDTRTKKEKAIDGIVKTLERSMAYKEAAEIIYNEWVGE